eukprot:EG_transcript_64983
MVILAQSNLAALGVAPLAESALAWRQDRAMQPEVQRLQKELEEERSVSRHVAAENGDVRAERDAARRALREERQHADRVAAQLEALEAERDAMHAALQRTEQE